MSFMYARKATQKMDATTRKGMTVQMTSMAMLLFGAAFVSWPLRHR